MNKDEAGRFLAAARVAYHSAYLDQDRANTQAMIALWHRAFAAVPYPIMSQCLNRFLRKSKFAPTVAELGQELKSLQLEAEDWADAMHTLGNRAMMEHYLAIARGAGAFRPDPAMIPGKEVTALEHPEIRWIEATGYPSWMQENTEC